MQKLSTKLKVLVACEESQEVTRRLRQKGFLAYSNDIIPCSGGHPEWHIQLDLAKVINEKWDAIIAFPPCTHLASSGAKHFAKKIADGRQQQGIDFFMMIANADCPFIAIENPVGVMSTKWRKPDQIIQPWQFGDKAQKTTCLWLKGFNQLEHTQIVDKGEFYTSPSGKRLPLWYTMDKSSKGRSKTFPGIAQAMADQWGEQLKDFEKRLNGRNLL
jgi:site-specific DNA-cytosine methylase